MAELFYVVMLGFFLTHELDAMQRHEWRILPLTSFLPEQTGRRTLVWMHVPLFAVLFFFGAGDSGSSVASGLSVFAIIHVGLHWFFRNHPKNEFDNPVSWALIIGAGLGGAGHLATSQLLT